MSIAGAIHFMGLDKRIPKLRNYILAKEFYDEITQPASNSNSPYGNWLKVGTAALAGAIIANDLPAIARAGEKPAEKPQAQNQENLSLYNYAIGAGRIVVPQVGVFEDTAVVRLTKEGMSYTIHRPVVYNFYGISRKIDSGFVGYNEIGKTKSYLEQKEKNRPSWEKILGKFFIKSTPTADDHRKDVIEKMQQFAVDDLAKNEGERKLPDSIRSFFLPTNFQAPQLPERPMSPKLEDRIKGDGYIELKPGTVYFEKIDTGLIRYRWLNENPGKKEGVLDLQNPVSTLEAAIAAGIVDTVRGQLKEEAEQYQGKINKFSQQYKGLLLSINPNISNSELDKFNFGLIAEGFVPVFVEHERLVGLQFSGRYARVSGGNNILEGALGVVVNTAIDQNSMTQIGVFYQHRHDTKTSADFGVISGTLAYQTGNFTLDFYAAFPVTGKQRLSSDHSATESTDTGVSDGVSTETTTRVNKHVREYAVARKVLSLTLEYDFRDSENEILKNLKLRGGVVWYSGIEDRIRESGNVKETREGFPDELKAALGVTYLLEDLSRSLDRRVEFYADARLGQGKPEFFAGLRAYLGQTFTEYQKQKSGSRIDLHKLARILGIQVGKYKITKETTTKSPQLTANCPTTGTENVAYICDITADGTDFSLIKGPSFLSLVKTGEHTARYSGTPGFDAAGAHQIEIEAKNPSKSTLKYTLTISDVNQNPALNSIDNKTGNENSLLEFIVSGSDPDNDSLTFSASGLPSGASFSTLTRTFSWKPSFSQSGTYQVTFKADDSKGGSATKTITITITDVNQGPSVTLDSPSNNTTITAGQSVSFASTGSDPDNDPLSFTWNTSGTCPSIPSVEDPGSITFNTAGTCTISVTTNDGRGGTATSASRTVTINAGGGGPPPI